MKKIITMLFLSLLVFGKVFAVDWVKVLTNENEEMETYNQHGKMPVFYHAITGSLTVSFPGTPAVHWGCR